MASNKVPVTAELIEALRAKLKSSELLTPLSPAYEESIKRWSDAAIKRAGMVLLATNAEDISTAVRFVQANSIDLAIRGGGHSVAGTSSSDGGLVIDLSRMRKVTVNTEKKTITAQGGAIWADVDSAAATHNLAAVGGTVNHTGIGGLTLGGGYGWLSSKYGLVIDNLISAQLVLANGRIVTASANEHQDLFWAIRGAGYNFGVAVEFTYQGHDQPNEVYAGPLVFPMNKLEAVIQVLNATLESPDEDSGAMCAFVKMPNAPDLALTVIIFCNGGEDKARGRFKGLFDLEPEAVGAKMIPYCQVNSLMNSAAAHGGRRNFKGLFFSCPINPDFVRNVTNIISQKFNEETDMAGSLMALEFFDLRKTLELTLNDTAFANRGTTLNGILSTRHEDPANDAKNRQWARDLQLLFKQEFEKSADMSSKEVPQYINYSEPGDTVVPDVYGVNGERLQNLKARYDPGSVFGKMHPIVPKV